MAKQKSLAEVTSANIRRLRLEKKLTQTELAEKAGISVSYVSMLERGQRHAPLETLEALIKVFKVPVAAMFDGHEA